MAIEAHQSPHAALAASRRRAITLGMIAPSMSATMTSSETTCGIGTNLEVSILSPANARMAPSPYRRYLSPMREWATTR
jgi:hypothetical protein